MQLTVSKWLSTVLSALPLYRTLIRRFAPPSSTEAVGECSAKPGVRRCEKIAALPHGPVANDFFTPSEGLCLNANELLARVLDLGGPQSARDGYSSSLATEACSGMWPSKTL